MKYRPISPLLHGIIDYVFSFALLSVPSLMMLNRKAQRLYTINAFGVISYSAFTKYPPSVKQIIPLRLSEKPKRFRQIAKEVSRITDKTLSRELKSLEANKLIRRDVYDTFPPTVEYSITQYGLSLEKVLDELHFWGLAHRKKVIGK